MLNEVLVRSYPAVPGSVSVARDLVVALADAGGASRDRSESVRLAVSEALTNAVEQARCDEGGEVRVTAMVDRGQLVVMVADDGREAPRIGFGPALIAACSDHFLVGIAGAERVQVEMRFQLEDPHRTTESAQAKSSRSQAA